MHVKHVASSFLARGWSGPNLDQVCVYTHTHTHTYIYIYTYINK